MIQQNLLLQYAFSGILKIATYLAEAYYYKKLISIIFQA